MKLRLANPPRPWMRHRWLKRAAGRLAFYVTADRHRFHIHLNRYPGEIIGVAVTWRKHCLSWVWPVWIVGLRLTKEQFDRGLRDVIDTTEVDDAG